MTPGVLPLNIYRGDTYNWEVRLWADQAKTDPIDLTGVTSAAQIRQSGSGSGNLITAMDLTLQLPNILWMSLSAPNSLKLYAGNFVWDLQLTYPDGSVRTVLTGNVNVTQDVTA
jgi:hypothetical protein